MRLVFGGFNVVTLDEYFNLHYVHFESASFFHKVRGYLEIFMNKGS